MSFIAGYETIRRAFNEQHLSLSQGPGFILINNSSLTTPMKVKEVIQSVGFCPLVSKKPVHGAIAFSIVPYLLPTCFESYANYFKKEEVKKLIIEKLFYHRNLPGDVVIPDFWKDINRDRNRVFSAVRKAFSEVIDRNMDENELAIEIGSGVGYSFTERLSKRILRTQSNIIECQNLSKTYKVYEMAIKDVFNFLKDKNKKIPLFFGVNVFDTLTEQMRLESMQQISSLQNPGDRIVFLLDTNPFLNTIVDVLNKHFPNHMAVPYLPDTNKPRRLQLMLMRSENGQKELTVARMGEIFCQEMSYHDHHGKLSERQAIIHERQKQTGELVLEMEKVYLDFMRECLLKTGYSFRSYYHAAFTPGEKPSPLVKQFLMYRANEIGRIRQWDLNDPNLIEFAQKDGITLPKFDPKLAEQGKILHGAEVLVIEAIKQ